MSSNTAFVVPVALVKNATHAPEFTASSAVKSKISSKSSEFAASGLRSSSFVGESKVSFDQSAPQYSSASTFVVQNAARLPLLPYRPAVQNSRVENFGGNLLVQKPATYSTELIVDQADIDKIVWAAYRQIYSEQQILSAARQQFLESQLRVGEITVRDFIRGLLVSDPFVRQNFNPNSNYRFVEKVIQRALGRDVYSRQETYAWAIIVATAGVAGFVDAILCSEEYMSNFGEYVVPFQRNRVLAGRSTGAQPFNLKNPRVDQKKRFSDVTPPTSVPNFFSVGQGNRADFSTTTTVTDPLTPARKYNIKSNSVDRSLPLIPFAYKTQNARVASIGYKAAEERPYVYSSSYKPDRTERGEMVWAAFRQIFSEHETIGFNRQAQLESEFLNGDITVKEFIRGLITSEQFLQWNFAPNSNYRFVEIVIQRLLGRDVYNDREKIAWSIVICNKGVPGFIDAVLNSDEYNIAFGNDIVPYQRSRVLPQRPGGETPFNLKSPRYDAYYRNKYTTVISPLLLVPPKRINAEAQKIKAGDPREFLNAVRVNFANPVREDFELTPVVPMPRDYFSAVPSRK